MADKNKSGDFYDRPEKLGAWAGFSQFLWNGDTKQFMGRTGSSWGEFLEVAGRELEMGNRRDDAFDLQRKCLILDFHFDLITPKLRPARLSTPIRWAEGRWSERHQQISRRDAGTFLHIM